MKYKVMWYYGWYNYRYIIVFKKFFGFWRLIEFSEKVVLHYKINRSFIEDFHEIGYYREHSYSNFLSFITNELPCDFHHAIKTNQTRTIYLNDLDDIINEIPEEFL